jgi:hypothetical protein
MSNLKYNRTSKTIPINNAINAPFIVNGCGCG